MGLFFLAAKVLSDTALFWFSFLIALPGFAYFVYAVFKFIRDLIKTPKEKTKEVQDD